MITSVAIQAYLTKIRALFKEQGFDDSMKVIYDSENAKNEEWLADELAEKKMDRKGMTTKEDVRSKPFMCLFWTRTSLEPIVRQRYRLLDTNEDPENRPSGKSTVSASFKIACAFVSNKAEAVEDLEEAFAAVFQNTYNMPLTTPKKDEHGSVTQVSSLEYIYNSEYVKDKIINFTYIQNLGEADLVNFKEGNLFAYSWSATIYMNYVSEFAWSRVYPVEKLVIDLYNPKGFPISSLDQFGHAISSLDQFGHAVTKTHTATTGETVKVPAEPAVAFTAAKPHDYAPFAITAPYAGTVEEITPEARALIESAVVGIGGEVSIRKTPYMAVANMPLSLNHDAEHNTDHNADMLATAKAVSDAIKQATGEEYVVTPMPVEG